MNKVRRRNVLVGAVAVLVVFLIAVGANGIRTRDFWGTILGVYGVVIGYVVVREFVLECSILKNPCETSASVLRVWSPVAARRRRMMLYKFLAQDGSRYVGSGGAPKPVPEIGSEVPVLYRLDRPNHNLPKRRFWFHELQS